MQTMSRRWSPRTAAITGAIVLAVTGSAALLVDYTQRPTPPPRPEAAAAGHVAPSSAPTPPTIRQAHRRLRSPTATVLGASPPVEIRIPSIAVQSHIVELGQNADGTVAVPSSFQDVGWYKYGVTPGQNGPAVFLGHVDSTSGPGIFYRVGALHPGDHVLVTRQDGRTATYTITAVRAYPKSAFPTIDVYGNTAVPTIRLVTCGGTFDSASGHYRSNIIAYGQQH